MHARWWWQIQGEQEMKRKFKIGDHVGWNSEAGHVSGTIIKIHTRDFEYKGHTHHASADDLNTKSKATRLIISLLTKARPFVIYKNARN